MTKTQIELLMAKDVDDVSEAAVNQAAVNHSPKQLGVTLKNAAALLARADRKNDFEECLFVFKLLRFVQAALAGAHARVTAEVAREIYASVQLVLKRKMASDLDRAARDVLSVLMTERMTREMLEKQFVTLPEMLALHQRGFGEPLKFSKNLRGPQGLKSSKSALARQVPSAKSEATRTKGAPKPKGLPR